MQVPPLTRTVLFDALGTLVELRPPAPALKIELAERFGIEVSLDAAQRAIAAEIAYYRAHLDEGRDQASLAGLRHRCAEELRTELSQLAGVDGGELTAALLASLRFRVFDDVEPALGALRDRGRRLLVVSNWDVSLHDVLGRLGLGQLLDGILTSAEVGARKPDPAIFRAALELAGSTASEALHIGDSLEEDVAGALAAGIEPILIARNSSVTAPGVRTIAGLGELEGIWS